ncbi:hypothetical protein ABF87_04630 [Nitrosomonas sp. JL21]|uniref:hypothetical protein n=1 Tax=Nitrosomonas sp. JL21 TaxID=153949 RepID=UPI00136AC5AF|nr:hypothetical protein [Nitrosomonas sp. JL21]MBL8498167.1 hypothetical protein [Nitrosomonas sp.]MXS77256.1 hypothetical protein [Nitrosomonas sp. JL21]
MKNFSCKLFLISILLFNASLSQADSTAITKFSTPAEYCFPQTSLRGGFDKIILDHHVIISPEDHFKNGDVFVGARFKSKPDVLWLTDGFSWWNIDDNHENAGPKSYTSGKLQPIVPTSISYNPVDVTEFIEDGEIWVGYGLRSESETWRESFEDMKRSQRFNLVWEIGVPGFSFPSAGLHGVLPNICLTATEMKTIVLIVQTPIVNPDTATPDIEAAETIGTTTTQQ